MAGESTGRLGLFPTLSTEEEKKTRYNYQELRDFYGRASIHPFILYLENERVYIERKDWFDKMVEKINRFAKDAGGRKIEDESRYCDTIDHTLSRGKSSELYYHRCLS